MNPQGAINAQLFSRQVPSPIGLLFRNLEWVIGIKPISTVLQTAALSIGHDSGIIWTCFVDVPLFQTSFLPDLIHVKVLFEDIDVTPAFLQAAPALTAELAGVRGKDSEIERTDKKAIVFLFTYKAYLVNL